MDISKREPRWGLRVLGGFELTREGDVVAQFGATKEGQLLAYLAMRSPALVTREELVSSIWPDHDRKSARKALSFSLFELRRDTRPLGIEEPVESHDKKLCLNPEIQVDARQFTTRLASAASTTAPTERVLHLDAAIRMYGAGLLPGATFDWLRPEQERFERLYRSCTGLLAELTQPDPLVRGLLEDLPSVTWQQAPAPLGQDRAVIEPQPTGKIDLDETMAFAANAADGLQTEEAGKWVDRVARREYEILGAADLLMEKGRHQQALEMITPLWRYWYKRNRQADGLRAMEMVLGSDYGFHGEVAANAYMAAGNLAFDVGRRKASAQYITRALEHYQQRDDARLMMRSHANLGRALYGLGEYRKATAHYDDALGLARALEDAGATIAILLNAARCHTRLDDHETSLGLLRQREALLLEAGDTEGVVFADTQTELAAAMLLADDLDGGEETARSALALHSAHDNLTGVSLSAGQVGWARFWKGDLETAHQYTLKAADAARRSGRSWHIGESLGYLAIVQEALGHQEAAATMWEASAVMHASGDSHRVAEFEAAIDRLRAGGPS